MLQRRKWQCRGPVQPCGLAQVRGFWLGPWMQKESGDPQRVLKDTMALLADGTIVPEAGALLTACVCCVRVARRQLKVHKSFAVMQRFPCRQ